MIYIYFTGRGSGINIINIINVIDKDEKKKGMLATYHCDKNNCHK